MRSAALGEEAMMAQMISPHASRLWLWSFWSLVPPSAPTVSPTLADMAHATRGALAEGLFGWIP